MVRAENGRDYYVEEPALVTIESAVHAVMPLRWFERADRSLWGRVRALGVVSYQEGDVLAVDARVDCFDVPLSSFLANYEDLRSIHDTYELPEPSRIEGAALVSQWVADELIMVLQELYNPTAAF